MKRQIKEDSQNQKFLFELITNWTQRMDELQAEIYGPLNDETSKAEILKLLIENKIVIAVSVVKVIAKKPKK